jgi:putative membrane protein
MTPTAEPQADAPEDDLLPWWLRTYLTGLAMGSADAVPGVSGGTIALIAGIYDRLVAGIAAFDPRQLVAAAEQRSHRPLVELLWGMDAPFLVALGFGAGTGVVGIAQALEFAYTTFRAPTYAFFFGLIAASAVALRSEASLEDRRGQVVGTVGFLLAVLVTGVGSGGEGLVEHPVVVFLAGAFVISAMILPGVSGAFLLLLLGLHEFMVDQLNGFVEGLVGLASGGGLVAVREHGVFVVAFCFGAGVGLLTFARVVEAALERDRATTLTFLVALMAGSLRLPAEEVAANVALTPAGVGAVLAAGALGVAAVAVLDRYSGVGYE